MRSTAYPLPMPPRSIRTPSALTPADGSSWPRITRSIPVRAFAAANSASVTCGSGSPSFGFHRAMSVPTVTSNAPPVSFHTRAAAWRHSYVARPTRWSFPGGAAERRERRSTGGTG